MVGGAGGAGAGAYSAGQPTTSSSSGYTEHPTTTTSGPGTTGAGAYSAYDGGRAAPTNTTADSGHNYGRDAAIVGGTGAAGATGYGAYEATQGSSSTASHPHDPTQKHPHHDPYSTEHHVDREQDWRHQSKGGPLGFLHSNHKGRFDDKEEPGTTAKEKYYGTGRDHATHPLDSTRQESSNYAAPAAVGAGAAGIGGATAYEATHQNDPRGTAGHQSDHGTSGHGGQAIGGGSAHRAHEADTSRSTAGHSGTTAATGAGVVGAGAAGVGASSAASHFAHHDPTGPGMTFFFYYWENY